MVCRPCLPLSPAHGFGSLAESLVQKKALLRLRLHGPISVVLSASALPFLTFSIFKHRFCTDPV